MRQRAAESDVVIVNHHLLCADAAVRQSAYGEVIPDCRYAIVDEAHQLEDVATQYFGMRGQQLPLRRSRARRRRAVGGELIPDREQADEHRDRRPSACAITPGEFFAALQMLRFERAGGVGRRRAASAIRPAHDGQGRPTRRLALAAALEALEADIALAKDVPEDVLALGRRAAELRDDLSVPARAPTTRTTSITSKSRGRGVYPARVADRRLGDRPRDAARSDDTAPC